MQESSLHGIKGKIKFAFSGKSLYLAVILSFVATILAFSFLLSRYYGFIATTNLEKLSQLRDDVNSAIRIGMQQKDEMDDGEIIQIPVSDDPADVAEIQSIPWGVYHILRAKKAWKQYSLERIALCGRGVQGDKKTGLYLADHGHYLAVAGDTYLSGDCYLPRLGVRKAYIDGKSFTYQKTVDGNIHTSDEKLPPLSERLKNYLKKDLFYPNMNSDSMLSLPVLVQDEISNSYSRKTIRIAEQKEIQLSDIRIEGNIIIQSEKHIIIHKTAELNGILCLAPVIEVMDGFEGAVQLIATDSIILHENANLLYPSALVGAGLERSSVYVALGQGSRIAGTVVLFAEMEEAGEVTLIVSEQAIISGIVYCSGKAEHKGKISGSLYCDKFRLQTLQGYYENHLLNAWVDPLALEPSFAGGDIFGRENNQTNTHIIQWLE